MNKIIGVYKITNTITNDFYIGSSNNVKHRWAYHKCQSSWNKQPNNPLYQNIQKYGLDKFIFEILAEVEADFLKETEQHFIEALKPTYNSYNAKGLDIERRKKYNKEYEKSDKRKKYKEEYNKEYRKSDKFKKYSNKYQNKYNNQLCSFNDEILALNALSKRFRRQGISNPTKEAKKYLI